MLPLVHGRKKGDFFGFLLEKVLQKLQGWKQKGLSQAGREVLIKSVIQAIPTYAMQCYLLPKDPKVDGGLGFHDLEAFNTALLAKQWWRLLMNPGSFWGKVIKGLYFPRSNFLIAKRGSRPSWLWNSLLHGHDLLLHGVRWQNGAWNTRMLQKYVSVREAEIISGIPISQTGCPDELVWHFDAKGQYTVKSGYKQALLLKRSHQTASKADTSSKPPQQFWKTLWNIRTQPKIKLFAWKALTNSVATMDNLFKRNCSPCPKCPICNTCAETIEHPLFKCAWTQPVWFGSSLSFRNHPSGTSVSLRFQIFVDICKSSLEAPRILSIVVTICWFIWRSRCAFVYDNVDLSPERTLTTINAQLNEFDKIMASNLTTKAVSFKDSKAALAVVALSTGSLIYVNSMLCSSMSPLHAKVLAVHYACQLAFRRGWSQVIVESDYQTAITLSSTETIPPWNLAALVSSTF
ncbi:nucleotide-binding alpha-beta plait domain-containing protein [Tanacetum coccineum]